MQADATQIAWAAGFIDGEGSISVRRIWNKKLNRYMFQLYLRAAQVELAPLTKLQELFGGKVHSVPSKKSTCAPYFSWYLTSGRAAVAIQAMLPYLTIKKDRGLVGLEFNSLIKRGRMLKEVREESLRIQEEYWERMRYMNLRYVQRRAAAETKSRGSQLTLVAGCDSPVCIDGKDAEAGRNDQPSVAGAGKARHLK